ncbi:MAG: DUF2442 domain-containing protein [Caldilinea sp. CFX5]|nr:DUF2442 domain-containing protein [Caldilinea sp. CFX5]
MFVHVTKVEYLKDYQLRLTFSNGVEGVIDLKPELYGKIFEPLLNQALFRQVFLTSRTIEWPNGADFAPEYLLSLVKGEQATQMPVLVPA